MDKRLAEKVYDGLAFKDWNEFSGLSRRFEDLVLSSTEGSFMKLVGSASTGTMRHHGKDMDYAVVFDEFKPHESFVSELYDAGLEIKKVTNEPKYGYIKVSGEFEGFEFVAVPVKNPRGEINTYEQDAFYHPDFINSLKREDHEVQSIAAKEFFSKAGYYKEIKGISTELMILKYGNLENLLRAFVGNDSLRVNFSKKSAEYDPEMRVVVDYPYLGNRSLVNSVGRNEYKEIKEFSQEVLNEPYKMLE